jgi:hypothetical protein
MAAVDLNTAHGYEPGACGLYVAVAANPVSAQKPGLQAESLRHYAKLHVGLVRPFWLKF